MTAKKMNAVQRLRLHAKGLEAQVKSLEQSCERESAHAAAIQALAAEGKDPLTGEAPEFYLVWRWGVTPSMGGMTPPWERTPTKKHPTRESATAEAGRLSRKFPGDRFYVLPAFGYWICEVHPPKWKQVGGSAAESDVDFVKRMLTTDVDIPF